VQLLKNNKIHVFLDSETTKTVYAQFRGPTEPRLVYINKYLGYARGHWRKMTKGELAHPGSYEKTAVK